MNHRIFCVARNYISHAKELNNEIPISPVIFMKPLSSIVQSQQIIPYPQHGNQLDYETEVVVQIGQKGSPASLIEAEKFISAFSLGLDLTLRDVQKELKQKGLPWEAAKSFDHSAPLGSFTALSQLASSWKEISFECHVNKELRQQGNIKDMLFSIPELILYIGKIWSFIPGDLLYTGTPAGVGALHVGDSIEISSPQLGQFMWKIQ